MLIIGLTGSIATGKSTVASLLASPPHSLPIVDADVLAREVVEPGTRGYRSIVRHFGPMAPDLLLPASDNMPENGPNGKGRPLNRAVLGRLVFGDEPQMQKNRAVLSGIVHPAVRLGMVKKVASCYLQGHWAVVLDVPLLFESRLDRFCGTTLVVAVTEPETQLKRLMDRNPDLSREDAENRVKSQMDVRLKAKRCLYAGEGKGVVLWNDGSKDELKAALDEEMRKLKEANPEWWAWLMLGFPPLAVALASWRFWQNIRIERQWREMQEKEAKSS
ncbi:dephospho-CoA kinase domain-containing protein [Trichoderma aethiopicum]